MSNANSALITHESNLISSIKNRLESGILPPGFIQSPDPATYELTPNQVRLLALLMKCDATQVHEDGYFQCTDEAIRKSHTLPNTQRAIRETLKELVAMDVITVVTRGCHGYRWVHLKLANLPLRRIPASTMEAI